MELAQQSHFSTRTSVYDVHSMIEEHRKVKQRIERSVQSRSNAAELPKLMDVNGRLPV